MNAENSIGIVRTMNLENFWYRVLIINDDIFFMYCKLTEHFLHSCVMHVGPKSKAVIIRYSITILTVDKNVKLSGTYVTQNYKTDLNEIIKNQDCPTFTQTFMKKCISEDNEIKQKISVWNISDLR